MHQTTHLLRLTLRIHAPSADQLADLILENTNGFHGFPSMTTRSGLNLGLSVQNSGLPTHCIPSELWISRLRACYPHSR
ncbi:hypothetical protein ACFFX0_24375 [Citricoccus parietis]|uniref:Uncharacterized protein n=1 Tax=Citricoccus parietis TaxID=592307 RepID=A0ABV5G5F2_9MICC